MTTLARKR